MVQVMKLDLMENGFLPLVLPNTRKFFASYFIANQQFLMKLFRLIYTYQKIRHEYEFAKEKTQTHFHESQHTRARCFSSYYFFFFLKFLWSCLFVSTLFHNRKKCVLFLVKEWKKIHEHVFVIKVPVFFLLLVFSCFSSAGKK